MQSRKFEIIYHQFGIYLLSSDKEFLEQKAQNIIKYSEKAYPKTQPDYKYTIKDYEQKESRNPYKYALCIDNLLPSIVMTVSSRILGKKNTPPINGVTKHTPFSSISLITGINLCMGSQDNIKTGYIESTSVELTTGDYIVIPHDQADVGVVYIDEDICITLKEKKDDTDIYPMYPNSGFPTLCYTSDVLKAHKLDIDTIKSRHQGIKIYQKDPELVFPPVFINSMVRYYELSVFGVSGQAYKNSPLFKLLEDIKQIKDKDKLNPKVQKIMETNYKLVRQYNPFMDDFITNTEKEHYTILDLNPNANKEEIRARYLRLSTENHPDKNPDCDTTEKYQRIVKAYEILSNDEERLKYDISQGYKVAEVKPEKTPLLDTQSHQEKSYFGMLFSAFSSKPKVELVDQKPKNQNNPSLTWK